MQGIGTRGRVLGDYDCEHRPGTFWNRLIQFWVELPWMRSDLEDLQFHKIRY